MRIPRLLAAAFAFAAVLAILGAGIVLAQGSDLNGKLLTGQDVTVPSGTINHDVYAFGGRVSSNGSIQGELVTAGGVIDVNGPVSGDVIATGGSININGSVGGHIRAAGGQVTVNGNVAKDVLVASGTVTINANSTVGGDLIATGGNLTVNGKIAGSATGSVGAYTKNGTVAGTDTITITQGQSTPQVPVLFGSNPVLDAIRQFIAVVLVGLLLLWIVPRLFHAAESTVRNRPLPALAWGIISAVGYFIVIVVVSILGALIAIALAALGFGALLGLDVFATFTFIVGLTLAFVFVAVYAADAIVGLAIAKAVLGRSSASAGAAGAPNAAYEPGTGRSSDRWADVVPLIVGVAVIVIVTAIPIIGPLVKLFVVLFGLGAVVWMLWPRPAQAVVGPGPGPAGMPGPA